MNNPYVCSDSIHYTLWLSCDVGVVPVIRSPRGNAAEMVAEALDKKIRENLRDTRNSMFSGDNIPVAQLR